MLLLLLFSTSCVTLLLGINKVSLVAFVNCMAIVEELLVDGGDLVVFIIVDGLILQFVVVVGV